MKILIIGGVAAGTKAAAKLKREDRSAEVKIITMSTDISYAGCGLPYYVGGLIESRDELIVNSPAKYMGLTGVSVDTGIEAKRIDAANKTVAAVKLATGEEVSYDYDKLVIAVGASAIRPSFAGSSLPGVFVMRTPDDAAALRAYIQEKGCKKAVVVGGGFIGLEIAENLVEQKVKTTIVDLASQIMPNALDPEMADYCKKQLRSNGIGVYTGVKVESIEGTDAVTGVKTDSGTYPADLVVLSIGIRPNTAFLADSGIEMYKGTILVDGKMATSLPDVYAAGDCAMVINRITGKPQWSPMGSTANLSGRTMAQVLAGKDKNYPGVLGTGVVKMPGLNAGRTGLTEAAAIEAGYDVETVLAVVDDKAHYYPGAGTFVIKAIADKTSHKLLGVQVLGGAVDKIIDSAVVGISMGACVEDFQNLDMAYAPPFSTAIHPLVNVCGILENKLNGEFETFTPAAYKAGKAAQYQVLDVHPAPTIAGAQWIDLATVHGPIEGIAKDAKLLLVCAKGKRGYFLQNRLKAYGYTNTKVLEGGKFFSDVKVTGVKSVVSPADVTRVKALGCLQDKNHPNRFNLRVITRNGKITAEENQCITECAKLFGTGEVAMTTRLTIEIQGIAYEKIDEAIEYLGRVGLLTGGTGSKVRPVVSCKGTTCQYGLLDSFSLSDKIHNRFYVDYHEVKLPHKFKIAVGGCPNNCVKPDLNDLGIIGQRVPQIANDLCKGCKVCQVEKACPMGDAKIIENENGERRLAIDHEACNHCGRCVGKCPFGAVTTAEEGYAIYIGGRWGKKVQHGQMMDKLFTSEAEVLDTVEKAILFFRDEGITGERFADTINRLGFDYVQEKILSDDLLANKEEVIKAQKHLVGGATC